MSGGQWGPSGDQGAAGGALGPGGGGQLRIRMRQGGGEIKNVFTVITRPGVDKVKPKEWIKYF